MGVQNYTPSLDRAASVSICSSLLFLLLLPRVPLPLPVSFLLLLRLLPPSVLYFGLLLGAPPRAPPQVSVVLQGCCLGRGLALTDMGTDLYDLFVLGLLPWRAAARATAGFSSFAGLLFVARLGATAGGPAL